MSLLSLITKLPVSLCSMPSCFVLPLSPRPILTSLAGNRGPGAEGLGVPATVPDSSLRNFNERKHKLLSYGSPNYWGFLFYCVFCVADLHWWETWECWDESEFLPGRLLSMAPCVNVSLFCGLIRTSRLGMRRWKQEPKQNSASQKGKQLKRWWNCFPSS